MSRAHSTDHIMMQRSSSVTRLASTGTGRKSCCEGSARKTLPAMATDHE